jgi:hypothetical protein
MLNYFLLIIPFTVLIFIILHFLFRLLSQFNISIFLREYSFWMFLCVMLFDGNLPYFSFIFFSDLRIGFLTNFISKTQSVVTISLFYLTVVFCVCGFIVAQILYGRLSIYFKENTSNSLLGSFYMSIQFGLKYLIFGSIHSILRSVYHSQLCALALAEFVLIFINLAFLKKKKLFIRNHKFWSTNSFAILRILIIFTLHCDYAKNEYFIDIIDEIQF